MRPLRVLFVLGSLAVGGTERQVIEILRHLDRRRFTPLLFLTYRQGELLQQLPSDVPVIACWNGPPRPLINWPGRLLAAQVRQLRRAIREHQIDLVYDRASHAAILAGLATPRSTPRISAIVADPQPDFLNSHPRFRSIKKYLLRRSYSRASRVATVSEGVRQSVMTFYGLPSSHVVTCPNLFHFERIRQWAAEPIPAFEASRFHIACVGRLQYEKGQRHLLETIGLLAHDDLPQILLRLIGVGPDEPLLRAFVASRQLDAHVRFLGFQSNPLPFIRQSHVLCLPSLFEGMPNALVEAIACGTPVIASDCPSGPREILRDGELGCLVPPGDPRALADALRTAYRDLCATPAGTASLWKARAAEAQRHVEAIYGYQHGIRKLEDLLEEVAAEKRDAT